MCPCLPYMEPWAGHSTPGVATSADTGGSPPSDCCQCSVCGRQGSSHPPCSQDTLGADVPLGVHQASSFLSNLFPAEQPPAYTGALDCSSPGAGLYFSLLNFMRLLSFHFFCLMRPLWMAAPTSHSSHLWVIFKLAEGTTFPIINKDFKLDWTQYWPLDYTDGYRPPISCHWSSPSGPIHSAISPHCLPSYPSYQLVCEDLMGNLTEIKVSNTHCLPLIYQTRILPNWSSKSHYCIPSSVLIALWLVYSLIIWTYSKLFSSQWSYIN